MRILMISSEVETFARTGGLGDAVLGLSRALAHLGHDVCIVTPLYGVTPIPQRHRWWMERVPVRVGWGPRDVRDCGVCEVPIEGGQGGGSLRVCLLAEDYLFGGRQGIYGDAAGSFGDNGLRFATLSRGALEVAARLWPDGFDVIHAHDWHAALAIVYARTTMGEYWQRKPSVFTIHNLAYQGVFGVDALDRFAIPHDLFHGGCLEQDGHVNLLKGATALCDLATTVSPTYAREIQRRGHGFYLEGFLRAHSGKLLGIANGIDAERFDPSTEGGIAQRYDASTVAPGKWACKQALVAELGLDWPDAPLFACVSRLTEQKGVDLLVHCVGALVERGARVVLIGKGDAQQEDMLRHVAVRYPGYVSARIAFDPALATRVYAGADFVVVPSRFEPCGLTQLYAMRFGAIPVVTDVGGLHDTVEPANLARGSGTGFVARSPTVVDLLVALEDAISAFLGRNAFQELRQRAMARDSSWVTAGRAYVDDVYRRLGAS
ncbi:MAG TPA: glycogen/starch synthase [Polyangiaceae bacterium]|nr:glycogen/starch synthase [Polyangiaceae bacterium]